MEITNQTNKQRIMNENTELAKQPTSLKGILSSDIMKDQFAKAMPKHLDPDRFVRIAITALTKTPKLQECTQESVFKCLLDLSSLGIEPDGRRAHLIPYGKECTLILDYKGIVELMRRSGDVSKIHADTVCENDVFEHDLGHISKHTFDLKTDRGAMYAVYAQVTLKDGSTQSAIMSKAEVDGIRGRSKAGKFGPWVSDYDEMAKKTAIRRVSKLVPFSPEVAGIIDDSEMREFKQMRNATPKANLREIPLNPFIKNETEGDDQ
tara:strand:+ start:927 stop:1718 length:792 start_codon:yes stop_codon:yes gene_type:complete